MLTARTCLRRRFLSLQFSTCSVLQAGRAIVYQQNGAPSNVLSAMTFPSLPPPEPSTVNIKFILSPINPADINVIEGVYPSKPSPRTSFTKSGKGSPTAPVFIPGNEGVAQITDVGSRVAGLQKGDWVIMTKQQVGTWSSNANVGVGDVLKVPREVGEVNGAVMTVSI
jgi:NADPH:quinone reductase-like Zn-dependent oxidoreductase